MMRNRLLPAFLGWLFLAVWALASGPAECQCCCVAQGANGDCLCCADTSCPAECPCCVPRANDGRLFCLADVQTASRSEAEKASPAKAAPAFSLQNQNGQVVSLADYRGKIVVLEWWNENCPYVLRHAKAGSMNALAKKYADKDVVWLAINSTNGSSNESNRRCVEQFKLSYPILNDASGQVGKAYAAKTTPHMFIVDKEGKLVYSGAIDDDPEGNKKEPVNYVAKALDELLAGKSVSLPETRPYGCSVKYAN